MIEYTVKDRWKIIEYPMRKGFANRRRGLLINLKTGHRYTYTIEIETYGEPRIRYVKELGSPPFVPKYITKELLKCL